MYGSGEGPGNLHVNKPLPYSGGCRPHFGGPWGVVLGFGLELEDPEWARVWQATGESVRRCRAHGMGRRGLYWKGRWACLWVTSVTQNSQTSGGSV